MSRLMRKDWDQLRKRAEDQGWRIEYTKNNHMKWFAPDGKGIVITAVSPSDYRAIKNTLSFLRQRGFNG